MFENNDEDGYFADLESEALVCRSSGKVKAIAEWKGAMRRYSEEKDESSDDSEIAKEQQQLEKLEDVDDPDVEQDSTDKSDTEQSEGISNFNKACKEDDKAVTAER